VLILGIIGFGILVGAAAQFILGRQCRGIDWGMALIAGIAGSFVGGLLFSLLAGDGLAFHPSGVIGSIVGAIIITLVWRIIAARRTPPAPPPRRGGGRTTSRARR
jgi:uncharacterized membrane protein YeaQ/YmgE (transglycosylase-associated protein family)